MLAQRKGRKSLPTAKLHDTEEFDVWVCFCILEILRSKNESATNGKGMTEADIYNIAAKCTDTSKFEENFKFLKKNGYVSEVNSHSKTALETFECSHEGGLVLFNAQPMAIQKYFAECFSFWQRNLAHQTSQTCTVRVSTVSFPKELLPEVKKRIGEFQDELTSFLESQEGEKGLYQLAGILFPLIADLPFEQ
jgi:Domain of unknown function (DUF4423)